MKKIYFIFTLIFLFFGCNGFSSTPKTQFNKSQAVTDSSKKQMKNITAGEIVKDMKLGWNLGNTLDATGNSGLNSEISWGQPKTTKDMIDSLAASGIKTIRIPVSWHNHLIDSNYTIDPKWMERVGQIVDWAIEDGMYVIINSHHDNGNSPNALKAGSGYYPNSKNYEEASRFLVNIWSQICLAFNNGYDEHLIFETMNEPRLVGTDYEWWSDENAEICKDAAATLNKLNQVVVDTIRASGGNNKTRLISVPGLAASPDSALSKNFELPKDKEKNHIAVSVHMYSPYRFAMESPGVTDYNARLRSENAQVFKKLNDKFVANGYPVIIGEFGATNKNNLDDRVKWFTDFIADSKRYGMVCCLWDNGVWEVRGKDYNEHFGYFNRNGKSWYFPEILDAMNKSAN